MAIRITEDAAKSADIPAAGSTTHWNADIIDFGVRVHASARNPSSSTTPWGSSRAAARKWIAE
jgi:hypothetical protein